MPTPLTDAIEALTRYANSVSGASDTTLSEAVATLASGYGGGGTTPQGFVWEKNIVTETGVTSGSNNSTTVISDLEPEVSDTTKVGLYIFYFNNNTLTAKAARFALSFRGFGMNFRAFYREPARATSGGDFDFYYSAGTEVKIIKFDPNVFIK